MWNSKKFITDIFRDVFRYIRSFTPDEITQKRCAGDVCKSIEISEPI